MKNLELFSLGLALALATSVSSQVAKSFKVLPEETNRVLQESEDCFESYGQPLAGTGGDPELSGRDCAVAGEVGVVQLEAAASSAGLLIISTRTAELPLYGGRLLVSPSPALLQPFSTDKSGSAEFSYQIDASSSGRRYYMQAGVLDAMAVQGVALSNGLRITIQ